MNLLRNLFAYRLARTHRRQSTLGRLLRLGAAHKVSRARGISGLLAKGRIGKNGVRLGLGAILALLAVGGATGARRYASHRGSLDVNA